MSYRRYSLAELGITESAAEALMRGHAQVVPVGHRVPEAMLDALIPDEESPLSGSDEAFFNYSAMLASSPYGDNANDAVARMHREYREKQAASLA